MPNALEEAEIKKLTDQGIIEEKDTTAQQWLRDRSINELTALNKFAQNLGLASNSPTALPRSKTTTPDPSATPTPQPSATSQNEDESNVTYSELKQDKNKNFAKQLMQGLTKMLQESGLKFGEDINMEMVSIGGKKYLKCSGDVDNPAVNKFFDDMQKKGILGPKLSKEEVKELEQTEQQEAEAASEEKERHLLSPLKMTPKPKGAE